MKWLDENAYGLVPRAIIMLVAILGGTLGLCAAVGYMAYRQGIHEKSGLHPLAVAPHVLREMPEEVEITDKSPYSEEDSLSLCQYSRRYYSGGRLSEEADYDRQGRRIIFHTLEYDVAGNILRERTQSEVDGTQMQWHIYEYNDSGNVVHEELYWDEDLVENNFFRYTEEGRAGVSYSYLDEQMLDGISDYCANHTEFLEDEDGNLTAVFKMDSLLADIPTEVWRMKWGKREGHLINYVSYCKRNGWRHQDGREWYQNVVRADTGQFNLYECVPDTGEKKLTLQLNYAWEDDKQAYLQSPSFYRAQYDGEKLLWQMDYEEGRICYYSACLYDADGRLLETVEYCAEGEEPEAMFHRLEYPGEDSEEQYSYAIHGREFSQTFGTGNEIRLAFSDDGILAEIEMNDVSENSREIYSFYESGENCGKLRSMCTGDETAEGEAAVLEKLEEERNIWQ